MVVLAFVFGALCGSAGCVVGMYRLQLAYGFGSWQGAVGGLVGIVLGAAFAGLVVTALERIV